MLEIARNINLKNPKIGVDIIFFDAEDYGQPGNEKTSQDNLTAEINLDHIKTSKIFKWLHKNGISDKEMLKTFNCGVGFCLIISPKNLDKVKKYFTKEFKPYVIGKISKGKNKVKLNGSINWI